MTTQKSKEENNNNSNQHEKDDDDDGENINDDDDGNKEGEKKSEFDDDHKKNGETYKKIEHNFPHPKLIPTTKQYKGMIGTNSNSNNILDKSKSKIQQRGNKIEEVEMKKNDKEKEDDYKHEIHNALHQEAHHVKYHQKQIKDPSGNLHHGHHIHFLHEEEEEEEVVVDPNRIDVVFNGYNWTTVNFHHWLDGEYVHHSAYGDAQPPPAILDEHYEEETVNVGDIFVSLPSLRGEKNLRF